MVYKEGLKPYRLVWTGSCELFMWLKLCTCKKNLSYPKCLKAKLIHFIQLSSPTIWKGKRKFCPAQRNYKTYLKAKEWAQPFSKQQPLLICGKSYHRSRINTNFPWQRSQTRAYAQCLQCDEDKVIPPSCTNHGTVSRTLCLCLCRLQVLCGRKTNALLKCAHWTVTVLKMVWTLNTHILPFQTTSNIII